MREGTEWVREGVWEGEERKSGCERGEREWWRKRGGGKSVGMREER
jgi:hypothetical protein